MGRYGAIISLAAAVLLTMPLGAATPTVGSVRWARLRTSYRYWSRHAEADARLVRFIRENTSLAIASEWVPVEVESLPDLVCYPFLFSEGIQTGIDPKGQANLREYLLRGGFLFIDACINPEVNPDPDVFLKEQTHSFQQLLPDANIQRLPPDHDIFRCSFDLKNNFPHSYMGNVFDPRWAAHGLYAVMEKDRMVALISLSGLRCGWVGFSHTPLSHTADCMKMMVNIYTYTITH